MNPQIIRQGVHPQFGSYLHALLPELEQGVSRILSITPNSAVLHEINVVGNIVSTTLDIPLIRTALGLVDSAVSGFTLPQ